MAFGIAQLKVLEDSEVLVDRRGLELAPDACVHDLVLAHFEQFLVLELHRAVRGLCAPADQVQHGGFSRPVGADDDAAFIGLDVETEVVNGFEAIKGDREALD